MRVTPAGDLLSVVPLTFGRARITFSKGVDFWGYSDAW
jgi:hypothetical protein